jgi:hypothetical protein
MKNPLILLLAILAITACTTQPVKAQVDYTSDEVSTAIQPSTQD